MRDIFTYDTPASGPGVVASIAIRYELDGPGIEPMPISVAQI